MQTDGMISRRMDSIGALYHRIHSAYNGHAFQKALTTLVAEVSAGSSREVWQRLVDGVISAIIVGGVFVVPLASLLALIGAFLPQRAPLHDAGPQLLGFAILWFVVAIFSAHTQPHDQEQA